MPKVWPVVPCLSLSLIVLTLATSPIPTSAAPAAREVVAEFPTQTPVPVASALAEPFAYGVASGDMTATTALLWTRTPAAADVVAELSTTSSFDHPTILPSVRSSPTDDFTVKVAARGLTPGTLYYYRFRGSDAVSHTGSFRTAYAPEQDTPVTIAFTGDAHWAWKPYPLLVGLVKEPLDAFIFLGDLIYESRNLEGGKNGSLGAESLDDFRWKYRENREPRPGSPSGMLPLRDLYEQFGQYSVFDNHETANSKQSGAPPYITGGAQVGEQFVNQTEGFRNRIQAYREYQPVDSAAASQTGDPRVDGTQQFYRQVSWGANVQLFILDDRSYRDAALASSTAPAAADCSRTMLGAPQLDWFENGLQDTQSRGVTWKVVVISSPIQELGRAYDGAKSWAGGYICERNQLLQFIDDHAIDNVVFLTTDNHYTSINNLSYNTDPSDPDSPLKPARNAFELITGPLGADVEPVDQTHNVDVYGLSLRDADRKVVDTWNGDLPDTKGNLSGLRQAGLDPIGLEASFPGLVPGSVVASGMPAGEIVAADFVSYRSFSYTVLRFDRASLAVRVMGMPAILDPIQLYDPATEQNYEHRPVQEILRFQVQVQ